MPDETEAAPEPPAAPAPSDGATAEAAEDPGVEPAEPLVADDEPSELAASGDAPDPSVAAATDTTDEPEADTPPDAAAPTEPGPSESERLATTLDTALAPVLELVGGVAGRVLKVEERLAEVARLGERHSSIIDELHRENQKLRTGELSQAMAPLFRDLIRLTDQLAQLDETSDSPGTSDAALAARQVAEILARAGVERFDVAAGEPFDPSRHQGTARRATGDPALDNSVALVRRAGYVTNDGKVLRAAEVEVHRYEAPAASEPPVEPPVEPPTQPIPGEPPIEPVPGPAPEPVPAEPQPPLPEPMPADPPVAPAIAEGTPPAVAVPPPPADATGNGSAGPRDAGASASPNPSPQTPKE
jgi:molecular chaperone GrpE (heat shock protein)